LNQMPNQGYDFNGNQIHFHENGNITDEKYNNQ
jgi:hypothetical protein